MRQPAHERRHQAWVQPLVELGARGERTEAGLRTRLGVRRDHVGDDPDILALRRHRQREPDHAHLGHAVDRAAGHAPERGTGRDVHEAPAATRFHHLPCRTADVERAPQLGVDHRVELRLGEFGERRHAHLTRVVDHHVDGSERVECGLHDGGTTIRSGDGVVVGDRLTAGADDLRHHRVGRRRNRGVGHAVGVADAHPEVVDHDARTAGREQECIFPSEVSAGAGDDHDLAVETKLITHGSSTFWRRSCVVLAHQ